MILFTFIALAAVYLLTQHDSILFKKIAWPIYGAVAVAFLIGLLIITRETTTYVLWVQIFFTLLILPVFALVIRHIWYLSKENPTWFRYTVSVPAGLLFLFTLWICLNAFPVVLYLL